jgi:predicted acetyltransferase
VEVLPIPATRASLTRPNIGLANDYLELLRETALLDLGWDEGPAAETVEDDLVGHIAALNDGRGPSTWHAGPLTAPVRSAHFWLVSSKGQLVGRVTIRYELDGKLLDLIGHIGYAIRPTQRRSGYGVLALQLALAQAHDLGLVSIVLVCREDNVGSRRIIERCGGLLQERFTDADAPTRMKRRYVIALSA